MEVVIKLDLRDRERMFFIRNIIGYDLKKDESIISVKANDPAAVEDAANIMSKYSNAEELCGPGKCKTLWGKLK